MSRKYKTAFLLPKGVKKFLGISGWEFNGSERIPFELVSHLITLLNLTLVENYLGMKRYIGENLQATVVYDDNKTIEHVYFQIYNDATKELDDVFSKSNLEDKLDLFFTTFDM